MGINEFKIRDVLVGSGSNNWKNFIDFYTPNRMMMFHTCPNVKIYYRLFTGEVGLLQYLTPGKEEWDSERTLSYNHIYVHRCTTMLKTPSAAIQRSYDDAEAAENLIAKSINRSIELGKNRLTHYDQRLALIFSQSTVNLSFPFMESSLGIAFATNPDDLAKVPCLMELERYRTEGLMGLTLQDKFFETGVPARVLIRDHRREALDNRPRYFVDVLGEPLMIPIVEKSTEAHDGIEVLYQDGEGGNDSKRRFLTYEEAEKQLGISHTRKDALESLEHQTRIAKLEEESRIAERNAELKHREVDLKTKEYEVRAKEIDIKRRESELGIERQRMKHEIEVKANQLAHEKLKHERANLQVNAVRKEIDSNRKDREQQEKMSYERLNLYLRYFTLATSLVTTIATTAVTFKRLAA